MASPHLCPTSNSFLNVASQAPLKTRSSSIYISGRTSNVHCFAAPGVKNYTIAYCSEDAQPFEKRKPTHFFEMDNGLRIVEFFKGKSLLITGTTGFFGKALIEKMLRVVPDVARIYMLINAKTDDIASKRLKREIIGTDLFRCLRDTYGASFDDMVLRKLIPVAGNVSETDLGLSPDIAEKIASEVDVIVNSAANTTFDERYDTAFKINTRGPSYMLSFAKRCPNLKLFAHMSTAYVNGYNRGTIYENALNLMNGSTERLVEQETETIQALNSISDEKELATIMRELGLKRAKMHGLQDTYSFTKAMGEMQLNKLRGETPVVIMRPSIIESSFKEPYPGWIEGIRMLDPIVVNYGKGKISGFIGDPDVAVDVVPVDMVVNGTLAAIAKHGALQKRDLNVYHIASSVANPFMLQDLVNTIYEHYKNDPHIDADGSSIFVQKFELFRSVDDFGKNLTVRENSHVASRRTADFIRRKSAAMARYFADIYEPYAFFTGRFDNSNTQKLWQTLSEKEKRDFGFDVGIINWLDYFPNVHIRGLRKHALKGRGMNE